MFITLQVSAKNKRIVRSLCVLFLAFQSSLPLVYAQEKHEISQVHVKEIEKEKRVQEKKASRITSKSILYYKSDLDEALVRKIDVTIGYLQKLADETPKQSPQRFKLLYKILNLHFEQASYVSAQENFNYETLWDQWEKNGRKGVEPQLNENLSKRHWKDLIHYSNILLKEYPQAAGSDRTLYNEAIAQKYLGQLDESAKVLLALVQRYPKSTMIHDAEFALGEYYFDSADFHSALGRFTKALGNENAPLYGWTLFKIGWCHYNLGSYGPALAYWEKTVAYSEANVSDKQRAGVLKAATLRDMIWGFLETKDTNAAVAYYRKHEGEEYVSLFLRRLANDYALKGDRNEAYKVWQKLLDLEPTSKEAFEALTELITASYDARAFDLLWVNLERLNKLVRADGPWAKANHADDVEPAQKKTPILILYYPKKIHQGVQKTGDLTMLEHAKKGYLLYLKLYPNARDYVEVMEYLADIYYQQKNYEKSGEIYSAILKMGKEKAVIYDETGKVTLNVYNRSAKNMLDCYSKDFLPEIQALLKTEPDFKSPGRPISVKAKNFINACREYVGLYPEDKVSVKNCDLQISEIYYRLGQRELSKKELLYIVKKYAGEKEGLAAAENLILLVKDKKPELIEIAQELIAIPAYQTGAMGDKLRELLRGIELEGIANESSKAKRANLYMEKVKKSPHDRDADKLAYNAANDYLSVGEVAAALGAFALIVSAYPNSKVYDTSLLSLAKMYDKMYDAKSASTYFFLFVSKFPNAKEAPAAEERGCILAITLDYLSGWNQCRNFVSRYPQNGVGIVERLIQISWYHRNYAWMTSMIYQTYLNFPIDVNQKIVALSRVAKVGSPEPKADANQKIVKLAKANAPSGEASRIVAEIYFHQGEQKYIEFMKMKFVGGTVDHLQASIQSFSNGLSSLEAAFGPTLATQDAYWGVAVFYRLASAYEHFAGMMSNPPAVEGVEHKDLVAHLQESVHQVMAKAKEYYETGVGVAMKFTVYNSFVPALIQKADHLDKKPPMASPMVVTPDMVGGVASGSQIKLLE